MTSAGLTSEIVASRFDESERRCSRISAPARRLVTTPHRQQLLSRLGVDWVPYGPWHARQMGSTLTACGRPAP
jgi:hypothetical protein